MQPGFEHCSEDSLELYSLGTLPPPEVERLEEHLLVCPCCQDRLTEMDQYVRAMRQATAKLAASPRAARPDPASFFFKTLVPPRLAWVIGLLLVGVALLWFAGARERPAASAGMAPLAVNLQALRGAEESLAATAPQKQPLVLYADLAGLKPDGGVELHVVDGSGRLIHRQTPTAAGSRVSARIADGLPQGIYWVRLYDKGGTGPLLREYGLKIN